MRTAIIGAPLDLGAGRRGVDMGPSAIRYAGLAERLTAMGVDCVDQGNVATAVAEATTEHDPRARFLTAIRGTCERIAGLVGAALDEGRIPIVLGGDHSITFPSASAIARAVAPRRLGVVHFDAHADAANATWGSLRSHGTPMRRLIESGAVDGRNFVQIGLRGYWPGPETLSWMREHGMRWHLMTEIESRGAEAVVTDAIGEALDGPEMIYLSVDIDVIDPGMAPGTGTPEPGGMLTRELLRAVRQVVGAVELAGMDVVEVAPPFDIAEVTAAAAHRCVLEAISALAARRRDTGAVARDRPATSSVSDTSGGG
jgi:agmatinase